MKRSMNSLFFTSVAAIAIGAVALTGCSKTTATSSVPAAASTAAPAVAQAPVSAPAAVTAPAPAGVPADDSADIATMAKIAQLAANPTDPSVVNENGIIDGPFNPSNQDLWASKPRADGYPAYAIACDPAKNVCAFTNDAGQMLNAPIDSMLNGMTVVRNADVVSGQYLCGRGICTDKEKNLVGRISPAMLALHPELAR